jgi:RNase P protein component
MSRRLDPIVCQIVDRCHVGYSNLVVIRYVVSRLKSGHATWRTLPKRRRKKLLRDIIYRHYLNRQAYLAFMAPGARRPRQARS